MYKVSIEQFEGPLDLLLEIIEAKKLPLVELSLAKIVDQFIDYLGELKEREPEQIVQFLVIASRLALLKSRELVPSQDDDIEEEGNIETLRLKLSLYQLFRQAAKELQVLDRKRVIFYSREAFAGFKSVFYFPTKLKTKDLLGAVENVLDTVTLPTKIPQARIKDELSQEEALRRMVEILKSGERIDVDKFLQEKGYIEKLIYFLSILELFRLGRVDIAQSNNFGKITMVPKSE